MFLLSLFPHLLADFLCSQDEVATVPKVHKKHKTTIDVSLFDDNFDIFADLTDNVQPKQKSKIKGETKSIFDDDMGKQIKELNHFLLILICKSISYLFTKCYIHLSVFV